MHRTIPIFNIHCQKYTNSLFKWLTILLIKSSYNLTAYKFPNDSSATNYNHSTLIMQWEFMAES